MGKKTKSIQNKQKKTTGNSRVREDRFGGIAPVDHAGNRPLSRKLQRGRKAPVRTATPGDSNSRWSRKKRSALILACLIFFTMATMYLIVPAIVQGPLVRLAGQALGCQVTLGRFSFSPFTFGFRGENVELVPQAGGTAGKSWLRAAAVTGKLQLLPLLQGRVRIKGLLIDQPEIFIFRDGSGKYNLPIPFSPAEIIFKENRRQLEPDIFSFQIVEGTVVFDDQLTGKKHRVEHILYNPATEDGPQLQAMVNGSPVTVNRRNVPGLRGKHLLQLHLDNVEFGKYLAYLPSGKKLPMSLSGLVKGTLELQLPDEVTGDRFTAEGVLSLKNVHLDSGKTGVGFDIPAARVSFELALLEGRLLVRELVLRQPDMSLAVGSFPALLIKLNSWLAQTTFRRFLVDQGRLTVQAGKQTFHFQDVQASVRQTPGNGTGNDSGSSTFQFGFRQADDLHGELTMEGKIVRGELNGHLRVRGVEVADLSNMMAGRWVFSGLEGEGKLDAEIVLKGIGNEKKQQLYFRNSRLQLNDFKMETRGGGKLSGKSLLCQASELLLVKSFSPPLCDRLDLEQAELLLPAAGLVQPVREDMENGLLSLFRDLEIKDSVVRIVDTGQKEIVILDRLRVQMHGLPGQADTPAGIGLQASIGEKGRFRLSGSVVQGKARLKFGLSDVQLLDIPILRSRFPLPIQEGTVRARGQLMFPEGKAVGDIVLNDFQAADESQGILQWSQLTATGARVQLHPFMLSVDDIALASPILSFPQGHDDFFQFAGKSRQDAWWRSKVDLKKIIYTNGEFQSGRESVLPGLFPTLTGLNGIIDGWPAAPFSFSFNGRLAASVLSINGKSVTDYVLEVEELPLAPLGEELLQSYGLVAGDARLSWKLVSSPDMDDQEYLRCVLKNLRPQPGSPLALTLALLTNAGGEIELSIERPEEDGRPLLLLERVIRHLQTLRLKELVLPGTIIHDQQPFLELPDALQFQAGQDSGDELFLLDDYAELLRTRPHLRLAVNGSFDPDTDGVMLQDILQEEENAWLEVENLRRERERTRWIRQQKQQKREAVSPGHSVESDGQMQYPESMQPLPRHMVGVPVELLKSLAQRRAEAVRQYLVMQQNITSGQIVVQTQTRSDSAAVYLSLQPFFATVHDGGLDDN